MTRAPCVFGSFKSPIIISDDDDDENQFAVEPRQMVCHKRNAAQRNYSPDEDGQILFAVGYQPGIGLGVELDGDFFSFGCAESLKVSPAAGQSSPVGASLKRKRKRSGPGCSEISASSPTTPSRARKRKKTLEKRITNAPSPEVGAFFEASKYANGSVSDVSELPARRATRGGLLNSSPRNLVHDTFEGPELRFGEPSHRRHLQRWPLHEEEYEFSYGASAAQSLPLPPPPQPCSMAFSPTHDNFYDPDATMPPVPYIQPFTNAERMAPQPIEKKPAATPRFRKHVTIGVHADPELPTSEGLFQCASHQPVPAHALVFRGVPRKHRNEEFIREKCRPFTLKHVEFNRGSVLVEFYGCGQAAAFFSGPRMTGTDGEHGIGAWWYQGPSVPLNGAHQCPASASSPKQPLRAPHEMLANRQEAGGEAQDIGLVGHDKGRGKHIDADIANTHRYPLPKKPKLTYSNGAAVNAHPASANTNHYPLPEKPKLKNSSGVRPITSARLASPIRPANTATTSHQVTNLPHHATPNERTTLAKSSASPSKQFPDSPKNKSFSVTGSHGAQPAQSPRKSTNTTSNESPQGPRVVQRPVLNPSPGGGTKTTPSKLRPLPPTRSPEFVSPVSAKDAPGDEDAYFKDASRDEELVFSRARAVNWHQMAAQTGAHRPGSHAVASPGVRADIKSRTFSGTDVSATASLVQRIEMCPPPATSTVVPACSRSSKLMPTSQSESACALQSTSLNEVAVNFITEAIESVKSETKPSSTVKLELAARQKRLEQHISETKTLMGKLAQAKSKQEKDAIMAILREMSRSMDQDKQGAVSASKHAVPRTTQASVRAIRWPQQHHDFGILIISDDEDE